MQKFSRTMYKLTKVDTSRAYIPTAWLFVRNLECDSEQLQMTVTKKLAKVITLNTKSKMMKMVKTEKRFSLKNRSALRTLTGL